MWKRGIGWILPGMAIWAGSLAWADVPVQTPNPSTANPAANANPRATAGKAGSAPASMATRPPALPSASASQPDNTQGAPAPHSTPAAAAKTALADAFIAQCVLRVYLEGPAAVSVFNSRGQLMFHVDSRRELETVPLQGISTGFIYLVVRTAQGELTRKLVYTGK